MANQQTMKTEKVLAVILIIGLTLRLFDIPGGSFLTVISMSILSFLYFPLGFYFLSHQKIDNKTVGFSVVSGLFISTAVTGTLFKIMHWPGALMVLLFGLIGCIPIAFLSYTKFTKPKELEFVAYYRNIFVRVLIVIVLGLLSLAL